jgi:hypothetical protein
MLVVRLSVRQRAYFSYVGGKLEEVTLDEANRALIDDVDTTERH